MVFKKSDLGLEKLGGLGLVTLWSCYITASNSAIFVGGGAKIVLPPSVWHPSHTTDKIIG